jgi:hypothetical protein
LKHNFDSWAIGEIDLFGKKLSRKHASGTKEAFKKTRTPHDITQLVILKLYILL